MTKQFSAGDCVEVRSKEEILGTLDEKGQLDGLPFMPQMFQYCGKRFHVFKRSHKTCDTVFPVRGRRMIGGVHLDLRCDGAAYGGCQAGCLIFWKDAWLRHVDERHEGTSVQSVGTADSLAERVNSGCSEEIVLRNTQKDERGANGEVTYVCQATQLPTATLPLEWWDIRQYWEDFRSKNVDLWTMVKGLTYSIYSHTVNAGIGVGGLMRRLYDYVGPRLGGTEFPRKYGTIPITEATPNGLLDLQPGELVRVKGYGEILETLNCANKNRGLYFDAEMVPYCGKVYRVKARVTRILDEKTGRMLELKNASIILEDVYCKAKYSFCRMFCPRSIYSYWREIWLERVDGK